MTHTQPSMPSSSGSQLSVGANKNVLMVQEKQCVPHLEGGAARARERGAPQAEGEKLLPTGFVEWRRAPELRFAGARGLVRTVDRG